MFSFHVKDKDSSTSSFIHTLVQYVGLGIKSVFAIPEEIGDVCSTHDEEFEATEIFFSDEGR